MDAQPLSPDRVSGAAVHVLAPSQAHTPSGVEARPRAWAISPRLALAASLIVCAAMVIAFGSRGITDESAVSLQGDMPRYLVDGTYFLDLLRDHPFANIGTLVEYTRLYFARYPALSLGHHPLLLPIAEVPAFAMFGVSVAAARVVVLAFAVAGICCWFFAVRILEGRATAFAAAVLLATTPVVVEMSQAVLSETPTMMLVLASVLFLVRFARDGRTSDFILFTAATVLSVYAKHLAAMMFPAYAVFLVATVGVRRLLRRDVVATLVIGALLLVPAVLLTMRFGFYNVSVTMYNAVHSEPESGYRLFRVAALAYRYVPIPTLVVALAGAALTVLRPTRGSAFALLWLAVVGAEMLALATSSDAGRYAAYWLPAFALLAARLLVAACRIAPRAIIVAALVLLTAYQGWAAAGQAPVGAGGYEEAAQFVVSHNRGATILYNGIVDTGYFVFYVRKHDPERQQIILRADKLLTTSEMGNLSVHQQINAPQEIYALLDKYGTAYVVTEDVPVRAPALRWLQEVLTSDRFVERRRIPIETRDRRLRGASIVIYEYRDARPPRADASLHIGLPLIQDTVDVRLEDLLQRRYVR
jgi:hypothetical protein